MAGKSRALQVVQLSGSLLIAAAFAWWAFRDTDWRAQADALRRATWSWLLPYVAALIGLHLTRVLRWLLSLPPETPFGAANRAVAVGNMMLNLLPLRLGELARPLLLSRGTRVGFVTSAATIVVERVVDSALLSVAAVVLLRHVPLSTPALPFLQSAAAVCALGFGGITAVLVLATFREDLVLRLVERTLGRWAPGLGARVAEFTRQFVLGVPRKGRFVAYAAATALSWASAAASFFLLGRAFVGEGAFALGFEASLTLVCVTSIAAMIPSAPGMAGSYQAAVKVVLLLFSSPAVVGGAGLAFANALWLSQIAVQTLIGLAFLPSARGGWRAARAAPAAPAAPWPDGTGGDPALPGTPQSLDPRRARER